MQMIEIPVRTLGCAGELKCNRNTEIYTLPQDEKFIALKCVPGTYIVANKFSNNH